jgi:cell filamentation protein
MPCDNTCEWFSHSQYPNGTLKNKFGIQDRDQLRQLEYEESVQNALVLLQIKSDIKDVRSLSHIHKILFGELYK